MQAFATGFSSILHFVGLLLREGGQASLAHLPRLADYISCPRAPSTDQFPSPSTELKGFDDDGFRIPGGEVGRQSRQGVFMSQVISRQYGVSRAGLSWRSATSVALGEWKWTYHRVLIHRFSWDKVPAVDS
jgi:hypothetical protein